MLLGTRNGTYYVSKRGDNRDGRSWATAWSELDQIDWRVIGPGTTIVVDGGAQGMTYTTTLAIEASGTGAAPITIAVSGDPGRRGVASIFGGRSIPLPYCGQPDYTYQTDGVREVGILVDGASWIVIDGGRWHGLAIHGHNRHGVRLGSESGHVTLRNLEIFDNGIAYPDRGAWFPDEKGVSLSGTGHAVEACDLHDNGQDAIQSGGVSNFALRGSWLHNARTDPAGAVWNYCQHSDGLQIYGGHVQSGILIEDSIVGPGFMHGVLLGDGNSYPNEPWAVVNDVTIRRTLFHGNGNANISSNWHLPIKPTNWAIENVTSCRPVGQNAHNVYLEGRGHIIRDSIFYGGRNMTFPDGGIVTGGNCQWQVPGGLIVGEVVDPRFVDPDAADFRLQATSPCAGKGACPSIPPPARR